MAMLSVLEQSGGEGPGGPFDGKGKRVEHGGVNSSAVGPIKSIKRNVRRQTERYFLGIKAMRQRKRKL